MKLDGNFYKKEISEKTTNLSTRRNNIERYLLVRYGMKPQFATKVVDVLEKTLLKDNLLSSGMYDSVIEMVAQQMTQSKNSSNFDTKHIRKSEDDEHLYSQQTTSSQSQNDSSQKNTTSISDEVMHSKQQYLEDLQKRYGLSNIQIEPMITKRSGRR